MIEYFVYSASSFAGEIDDLFFVITLIIGFWFFLTFGALVYFIFKFRRKDGVKAQYITGEKHSETKWTHYPHFAVIAMDVVIIAVNILVLGKHQTNSSTKRQSCPGDWATMELVIHSRRS